MILEFDGCRPDGFARAHAEWSRVSDDDLERLECVHEAPFAELEDPSVTPPYWGQDAPIDVRGYPYSRAPLYRDPASGCGFLVYLELGGHLAERRARWLRCDLVIGLD